MASDDTPDAVIEDRPDETSASRQEPERRCILSGIHGPRAGLIRLVEGPDGALWPDLGARLPGRGAWVAPDRPALEAAMAKGRLKGALARAFRASPPAIPADIADRIAQGLERRALDRLGLEHRAGHLIFGSDRITEHARAGRLHLLLHAGDAAEDGTQKLNQAFRSGGGDMKDVTHLPCGRVALSRALGRDNIVHIGVTDGKAAARIATDVTRWLSFHGSDGNLNDGGHGPSRRNDEGRE
ncbi:DUF448 domain-containing protein [Sandaracinobacteroides sp. A072]|uniref:DUF448 domain-containing protein n=1 Tax=Sandaracinobacteroides sp. A072 TaxID=3461146 RepID=UPI0040436D14